MRVRWTVPAADDLTNISNYLSENIPHVAPSHVLFRVFGCSIIVSFTRCKNGNTESNAGSKSAIP
jgi:hypothetical protein